MEPTYQQPILGRAQNIRDPEDPRQSGGKSTLFIIGGIILVIVIIALVYAATQHSVNQQVGTMTGPSANIPLNQIPADQGSSASGVGGAAGASTASTTVAGATEMVATPVTITGLDVVNLQTFPYKVQAHITGTMPDGCSTASASIAGTGKTFTITVVAAKAKDAMCTQVITPYDATIDVPVASLAAGKYTVKLGKIIKSFTLAQDNQVQYSGDK